MRIRTVLWIIALIYVLNWVVVLTGVGFKFEAIDVPFHFAGGFMQALLAFGILRSGKLQNLPKWFSFLFVVGFVAIISVGWEIVEFLQLYFSHQPELFGEMTLRDSLGDLVNDGLGAITAWLLFHKKK